ncbi:transglutaminase [Streptomyces sp. NA04227]|uniref:transglutaminase domain-containing protein n=1 Tax=Streptomyces sp. NA04227 TaxID=2742136 RepID=UPI00158FE043|nr:transglutaminase domain-containing protein [Streptomyces sp. NA04227]QKW07764.1 transglutaminase [Streptomyces sp. NA04227]
MTADTAAPHALVGALDRFKVAPPDVARYDTDTATAARALRAEPEQVARLAAEGLPHLVDSARGPLFDYDDLMNIGMFCGTGQTVPELGLRFLMRFAASPRASWFAPRDWEVGVHPSRTPGGEGAEAPAAEDERLDVTVRVPDLAAPGVELLEGGPFDEPLATNGYRAAVRLTGAEHTVRDPRIHLVWDEVVAELASHRVIYQTVPEPLRTDHHRAWELGVADCVVAARLLADRLRAVGLEARARRGYLLGLFGSDHAWCDVVEDGVHKSLDPVFAFVATVGDERGVAKSPEFAAACFGSRFNRLLPCRTDSAEPLVYFDAEPAPYWAMVGVGARPRRTV